MSIAVLNWFRWGRKWQTCCVRCGSKIWDGAHYTSMAKAHGFRAYAYERLGILTLDR